MDYLQQAIEKARKEGKTGIGSTPGLGKGEHSPSQSEYTQQSVTRNGKRALRKGQSAPPSVVEYSNTHSIELDDKKLAKNRVIAGNVDDPRVEAYRQLRSHVLTAMSRNGWNTLAITSAHEGAGKTTTAVNLAISMSREMNHTVMLIDLDLRKPNVNTTLGIEVEKGIVDHLMRDEPIENILINPGIPRLVIMPGLPQGHHASELLTSPEMRAFMDDITTRYSDRILIFDLPPLLRNDDAMVFVPNVNACLLVVEDGGTQPDELERSLELLKDAELLGTILNKARRQ